MPNFVIFSSYGNDSVALIQWAKEAGLEDVAVVYTDTKWAADWWYDRVEKMEAWVKSLGFTPHRTTSIGFKELARQKKAFPTQRYQWCSYILKIEPAMRWLDEFDPNKVSVCLVGVRREESQERANFPEFLAKSGNHGDRVMLAPLANKTQDERDALLARAGVDPLPHRSMECSPCINSNKRDLQALTEAEIAECEGLEDAMQDEFGLTRNGKPRTLFRPHRHQGAVGIREVVKWAHSPRGKYQPPAGARNDVDEPDDLPDENIMGCEAGFCGS